MTRARCLEVVAALMLMAVGKTAVADETLRSLLEEVARQRSLIQSGTIQVRQDHEIAVIKRPSYQGVIRDFSVEFVCEEDLWRVETDWIHRNWERQSVTLVNEEGAFHDHGVRSGYGEFTTDRSTISTYRPDTYDFRYFGLTHPPDDVVTAPGEVDLLTWAEYFTVIETTQIENDAGETLAQHKVRSENGGEFTVVLDPHKGNVPLSYRRVSPSEQGEYVQSTELSYTMIDATLDGEQETIWFPERAVHTVSLAGEVGYREVLTVTSVDFVNPPDPDRFDDSTLNLPHRRRVLSEGIRMMIFDGGLRNATTADFDLREINRKRTP